MIIVSCTPSYEIENLIIIDLKIGRIELMNFLLGFLP